MEKIYRITLLISMVFLRLVFSTYRLHIHCDLCNFRVVILNALFVIFAVRKPGKKQKRKKHLFQLNLIWVSLSVLQSTATLYPADSFDFGHFTARWWATWPIPKWINSRSNVFLLFYFYFFYLQSFDIRMLIPSIKENSFNVNLSLK